MLTLKKFSKKHAQQEYDFFQQFQNENGFINPYYGWTKEQFFSDAIKERNESSHGYTKPHLVPDTYYFLWKDETIIGLYKLRHYLNDFLKEGPGHLGYFISPEYRRLGYGYKGLKLLMNKIKKLSFFHDKELYLEINNNNIPSQKLALKAGGYVHHITKSHHYIRIPLLPFKHVYPILNHHFTGAPMINPIKQVDMPKKLVITFFRDVVQKLLAEKKIEHLFTNAGETPLEVYKFVGDDVCLTCGIVGAPATAGHLDDILVNGAKDVVFVGGAGSLIKSEVGELMLVKGAVRDEGFSYHYLEASDFIYADEKSLMKAKDFFEKKKIPFRIGLTWTTDAFYREFDDEVDRYRNMGVLTVEMEQAGLLALSHVRNINYVGILYFGDDLSGDNWSSREWDKRIQKREELTILAKELVKKI